MPKQLSLPERIIIERMLHQDYSFASIARALERSASTAASAFLFDTAPISGATASLSTDLSTLIFIFLPFLLSFWVSFKRQSEDQIIDIMRKIQICALT